MSDLEGREDVVAASVRQWKLANAAHAAIWPAEQAGDAAEAMMEAVYARGAGPLEVPSASALRAAATARDAAQRLHNQAQILSSRRDIAEQVGYAPPNGRCWRSCDPPRRNCRWRGRPPPPRCLETYPLIRLMFYGTTWG